MYERVARTHPEAAKKILELNPQPNELDHAREVGNFVRHLMTSYNATQDICLFSKRDIMSGFVAGVVHDIGCWGKHFGQDHTKRGARFLHNLVHGSLWIEDIAGLVEGHHCTLMAYGNKEDVRLAPLILAEAVIEGGKQALFSLLDEHLSDQSKGLLMCACNMIGCMPPLCMVRMRRRKGGLKSTLAVSLNTEMKSFFGPYLLRFAEVDGRGRPRPVALSYQCLIGPGHPAFEEGVLEVVDILSQEIYERLFAAYEGLIPIYQKVIAGQKLETLAV